MTNFSCPDLPGAQETAETICGTRGQRTCSVSSECKCSHCRDTNIQTLSCHSDTGQDSTSLSLWLTGKDHFWTPNALENHLPLCLPPQLNPFKFIRYNILLLKNFVKFCKHSKLHYIGLHVLKIYLEVSCLSTATCLCLAKLNLMWRPLLTDKSCTCAVGQQECTSRKVGDVLPHISCWVC